MRALLLLVATVLLLATVISATYEHVTVTLNERSPTAMMLDMQAATPSLQPFNCTMNWPKHAPATNVNALHMEDIKVVMALGDSMSAGFAMHSPHAYVLVDTLVEFRGDVFSIGGNKGQFTLPNFIKVFRPDLVGASIGNSLPLDAIKWKDHIIQPFDPKVTHLNGAQSQAKVADVPAQVDYLVSQLKTTYADVVDFENDWKMLTIIIGANNLCGACKGRDYANPDYYEQQLDNIMQTIESQIPRVFVNLLPMFNISQVHEFAMTSEYCRFMWKDIVKTECMCLQGDATDNDRLVMDQYAVEFRKRANLVAERWQAKNLPGFTVKIQPFTENLKILGLEFVSKLDCFHPSYLADGAFSLGLWNNLMSSPAEKMHTIDFDHLDWKCPGPDTVFQ